MTDLLVLLGHHIGYSASPAMHNAAFAALGLDAGYELADVRADALADAVAALRAPGRLGANVTQPHKMAVCDLVDVVAPEVRSAWARRTRSCAARTGWWRTTPTCRPIAGELAALGSPSRRAVVLGNGGASLRGAGRAGRCRSRGRGRGPRAMGAICRRCWLRADLLVNATPIGTGSDETPVDASLLRPDLAVLDLVYRPSPTRLVREALERGASAHGGAGVLLAAGGSELRAVDRAPGAGGGHERGAAGGARERPRWLTLATGIVLVGMPGSGKSTVGRLLASALGREFVDTDTPVRGTPWLRRSPPTSPSTASRPSARPSRRSWRTPAREHGAVIAVGGGRGARPAEPLGAVAPRDRSRGSTCRARGARRASRARPARPADVPAVFRRSVRAPSSPSASRSTVPPTSVSTPPASLRRSGTRCWRPRSASSGRRLYDAEVARHHPIGPTHARES